MNGRRRGVQQDEQRHCVTDTNVVKKNVLT
jgi:hypothetical protein